MDYHRDRFEDYSLLVFKNESLVAVLPANREEDKVVSHQGLTYGGVVISEKLKLLEFILSFKAILLYCKQEGVKHLILKELPSIYGQTPHDEIRYIMFILEATLLRRDTLSVLNVKQKVRFSKDRIAGYKRAKKHELVVKEVNDFQSFWNRILIPNLMKKHQVNPIHTLDEITLLKSRFPKKIRQFNVYKNDEIIAGTTIFETKNVAHSQYISGNEDKNTYGSLDFLHIHLIENVFKHKPYFDFGISNENNGKEINKGLNYWKEGFGARTITQDFHEIDVNNINKLDAIFND